MVHPTLSRCHYSVLNMSTYNQLGSLSRRGEDTHSPQNNARRKHKKILTSKATILLNLHTGFLRALISNSIKGTVKRQAQLPTHHRYGNNCFLTVLEKTLVRWEMSICNGKKTDYLSSNVALDQNMCGVVKISRAEEGENSCRNQGCM